MRRFTFSVVAVLFTSIIQSQTSIDSLEASLVNISGKEKADVLIEVSTYYNNNEVDLGISYARKALDLGHELGYSKAIYMAYNNIAIGYYRISDYNKSLTNYQLALEYAEIAQTENALTNVLGNIGIIYDVMGKPRKSIDYYFKALKAINDTLGEDILRHSMYINIGIAYASLQQYDTCLFYFEQALEVANKSKNISNDQVMMLHLNIAELHLRMDNVRLAKAEARKIIVSIDDKYDNYTQLSTYLVLGKACYYMGEYDSAGMALEKVLEISKSLGEKRKELIAYQYLSKAKAATGQYKKALELQLAYSTIKDSIVTEEKNKQLIEIEAKYEAENKRKEIIALKEKAKIRIYGIIIVVCFSVLLIFFVFRAYVIKAKANKILERLNSILVDSESKLLVNNALKDTLIRVIGHDLKNPLNSVIGFSELIRKGEFDNNLATIKKYNLYINKTARSANFLLENILYWARIQRGDIKPNKELVNCYKLAETGIAPYVFGARNKEIKIFNRIDDDLYCFGDKFMLSLVIGNLINNAIKFTPKGGDIIIDATPVLDKIQFIIKDRGIGIPQDTIDKLFDEKHFESSPGTNNEMGTGFGLKICKEFIELHGSTIWVESKEGKGSSFFFSCGLAQKEEEN